MPRGSRSEPRAGFHVSGTTPQVREVVGAGSAPTDSTANGLVVWPIGVSAPRQFLCTTTSTGTEWGALPDASSNPGPTTSALWNAVPGELKGPANNLP